jgi:hypothetical protein
MAKAEDNVLTRGFTGTIGKQLTFRRIGGQTFVSKYRRPSSVPPTEKAVAARTKFAEATAYAKRVVKNPEKKALYQQAVTGGQRAYNVAIMDALHAPVVENIDIKNYLGRQGDVIRIDAKDDFKVESVFVTISNESGEIIEQGNAVKQKEELEWSYVAINENPTLAGSKIEVVAKDLPGNSGSKTVSL